ncbi:MAG: hypothetical protein ACKOOG_00210, partial [Actinomycetota bacterium]
EEDPRVRVVLHDPLGGETALHRLHDDVAGVGIGDRRHREGAYRAVVGRGGLADGVAILRVRARGDAREAALCEVLAPDDAPSARRALVRAVRRRVDADYVLRLGTPRDGLLPLPGQGPILTWRSVTETTVPPLDAWSLTLGDIELF